MRDAAFIFENGAKLNKGMVEGSTVCAYQPNPPSKTWYEYIVDAVSFAGWVWDTFVTVWEKLKGFVADVIAVASGCVATAKLTGASLEKAKEFCSGLAQTAITVALAAYGVPPTMPKFADFADVAKGELKEFLIKTAFDQTGVDCNLVQAECEEMLDKLLDKMLDEIQLAASKAAVEGASSGGWVMWINPAIKVIPEPAGGRLTATFTMKVTRNPHPNSPPPPASCTTSAHVWGSKAHYEWMDYKKNEPQAGPVTGEVMIPKQETFDFSDLEPGESTKAIIVLDTINTWFPPGGNPNPGWLPVSGYDTKTGIFFSDQGPGPGGTTPTKLTMSLGGCLGGESVDFNQDHLLTEPWEILPYP
jgi:hypothetical protein